MKIRFLYFLIIQLLSVSTYAQSKCYLMKLDIGKKKNKQTFLLYDSLILNEDSTFISTALLDMQYSTCGIYEINNDILELKEFKINTDNLYIGYCEEPDVIKNIMKSDFETIPFTKYKIKNNTLLLLNDKGKVKRRVKDNFARTNFFTDLFGKKYIFEQMDCVELNKIH